MVRAPDFYSGGCVFESHRTNDTNRVFWQSWSMRRIEAPENAVRFRGIPQVVIQNENQ